MASSEKPLVYLILGARDSGRRAILDDLIKDLGPDARPLVRMSEADAGEFAVPRDATHVFFVADGAKNPVDEVEAFKTWLDAQDAELARVFTIVNCQFAARHAPLLPWFEACVHFSDVVLLNRREGVENKWVSDFLNHFKKQFYPCLFELVKDGRVKNPALVLEPQARRMSHVFDEEQNWVFTNASGEEIDEQEEVDDEDEISAAPEEDPYFARDAAGRRQKKIPDIGKFLNR